MWNPPPPDVQLNLAHKYNNGRRDVAPSAHSNNSNRDLTSPKISLNQDRAYNPDQYSDHGGDGQAYNYASGPHLIPAMNRPTVSSLPHPRLQKIAPYLTIATLQAYTVLTVVRCLADPAWIVLKEGDDKSVPTKTLDIGELEKSFLACAIAFTMASCLGVTLRILDKFPWLRKIPVMTAYLEAIFCIAALTSFLKTHSLPPGGQFSHGFLACVITVVFSSIVAIMLTIDWYKGFPSAGLSATLKALIISSFVMTIVIIIGAAIYSALEKWSFDDAVNFCIVSFATIGYGNLSPKTSAGQIIFFFYGLLGISSLGFFVVSLRNAVIEQFQWRLVDRFSKPAHLTRVQTRMSAKDMSFPAARFEEELQVKIMVKRKMIIRMVFIWIVMWFGGAGIFCAFEKEWTYLESLYFCFVTLTTIGFGDYVPEQPGSIEFWNVYVFVGLAVFAYILSLSSEGIGVAHHGTMYGAGSNVVNELNERNPRIVQTDSLRHQPLIKFDSPKGSVRSAGGERSGNPAQAGDNRPPGNGYIPSCMDVFGGQNSDNGEGPSNTSGVNLSVAKPPITRGRSNSWDGSASRMVGPSQNEIHRWLAEGAGTLEGPSFSYARQRSAESFQDDGVRHSPSSDVTRVTSPPIGPSGSKEFSNTGVGSEDHTGRSSIASGTGDRPHHRDGVAPDEIVFTEEPAAMTDEEERRLSEEAHVITQTSSIPVSPQPLSPPHEFVARLREPTLPRELNFPQQVVSPLSQTGTESQGLFLGGGTGAGYGTHALGVPIQPGQYDSFDSMPSPPHLQHFMLPISASASLFDDDLDHQATIHGSDSRPMSLFSNHHRSSHNSVIGSPVGSRPSSRAPSVLMTIFDEPVQVPSLSHPGSQNVSRSGSFVGGGTPRTGAVFPQAGATTGLGIGGVDTGTTGSETGSMHSPETSVGPFDEVRGSEYRLQFDDDVDLNHVEMSPELVQAEYARREDMKRREREVEAQLDKSGPRHHQQHGRKSKDRGEE
ncbi:Potassium channel [Haplosporangium bisporale]|nr:Potassium channel [Haplosporangium bisporale]